VVVAKLEAEAAMVSQRLSLASTRELQKQLVQEREERIAALE